MLYVTLKNGVAFSWHVGTDKQEIKSNVDFVESLQADGDELARILHLIDEKPYHYPPRTFEGVQAKTIMAALADES